VDKALGEECADTNGALFKGLDWQPLVGIWQKGMCKITKTSPQPPLPDHEFEMLKTYGYQASALGQFIL
jgi:hypothetical protein